MVNTYSEITAYKANTPEMQFLKSESVNIVNSGVSHTSVFFHDPIQAHCIELIARPFFSPQNKKRNIEHINAYVSPVI